MTALQNGFDVRGLSCDQLAKHIKQRRLDTRQTHSRSPVCEQAGRSRTPPRRRLRDCFWLGKGVSEIRRRVVHQVSRSHAAKRDWETAVAGRYAKHSPRDTDTVSAISWMRSRMRIRTHNAQRTTHVSLMLIASSSPQRRVPSPIPDPQPRPAVRIRPQRRTHAIATRIHLWLVYCTDTPR